MLPIIYQQAFVIHTHMTEDEAINTLRQNNYQTKLTGFFPIRRIAKQKLFFGNVTNDRFKVYLTSNLNSYLYMGIKGRIEEKVEGADITICTRGSSIFFLLSQILGSIFIAYIGLILAMMSTTQEQVTLFFGVPCLIIVGLIVSSFLSSRRYIKKAKQILFGLFKQSDEISNI